MYTPREPVETPLFAQDSAIFGQKRLNAPTWPWFLATLPHRVTSRHFGCFSTAPHLPPLICATIPVI